MIVLAWLLATVSAGWVLLRLTGQERGWPLVVAIAFTPYAAAGSLVPLAVAAAVGAWGATALAALATVAFAAILLPRAIPDRAVRRGSVARLDPATRSGRATRRGRATWRGRMAHGTPAGAATPDAALAAGPASAVTPTDTATPTDTTVPPGTTTPVGATAATHATAGAGAALADEDGPSQADGSGQVVLRVMTANLYHGLADPVTLLRLVEANRVDLLALQEYTFGAHRRLLAAGLAGALAYHVTEPDHDGFGAALFSRFPTRRGPARVNPGGYRNATAVLSLPGAGRITIESAHPAAPYHPRAIHDWYAGQATQLPATPDGELRLLMGDFNATLDHAALRRLLRTGYRDAASAVGRGLLPTWRHDRIPAPAVTLDHILVDCRAAVRAVAVHRLPGSDHRAVSAELLLPGPGSTGPGPAGT